MKKLISLLFFFTLSVSIAVASSGVAYGDTGTYRILDYRVSLTPHSDGTVEMEYYQKWEVTGGHIPWITVGLPNGNFTITGHGLAIAKIESANEGGWSGVRIDLDNDYMPGQTFEVAFSTIQNRLFYADEESYRLDFTPGWYERAFTDRLAISVRFFAKLDSVKTDPEPSSTSGETMVWERTDLGKGEKVSISVSFPKDAFPEGIAEDNLKKEISTGTVLLIVFLIFLGIIGIMFLIAWLSGELGGDGYSGGGIFVGGSSRGSSSRSTGGGGGLAGRSSSCACACVSCACACACAAGGAAGCGRKTQHQCKQCKDRERRDSDET